MAGVYRQKQCPTCGITHRRRGPYCSRSCAAKDRVVSAETKAKLSEAGLKRYEDKTGDEYLDAVDNLKNATAASKGRITDPVPPRMRIDRSGETIDGDYWVSADDW